MIVVTGATGSIGRALVTRLGGHEVLAAVRRPAGDLGSPYAPADLAEPETIGALLSPGDRLFLNSSLWPGVVDAHRAVIDLAAKAGVAQIVTVSVRDAAPGGRLGLGMHGLIDAHLTESGVPWAALRPSGFMQNLPGDFEGGTMYGSYGSGRISYIDARDIADVAATLLTSPVGPGRAYVLTGPEALSPDEIAAEIGRVLGRSARYVDLPVPELAGRLERQGMPRELALDLAELQAQTGDGSWAPVTTEVRDVTGRPPRTLADFLADHAAAFS
ncbi:SDR family oxidoreductase [Nonomuraea maheshkhaliensis]|uniref:SDR family oxidoreductase n=2 Tax=Nonomuraea maheshkhaliensis TaxID=419590 RepID=A0ABP4S4N5_9ACTN